MAGPLAGLLAGPTLGQVTVAIGWANAGSWHTTAVASIGWANVSQYMICKVR